MGGTASDFARDLGVALLMLTDAPFRVGCTADTVVCAWHDDERVREARAWEGLAQLLLTRAGVSWTEDAAICLGARLRAGAVSLH